MDKKLKTLMTKDYLLFVSKLKYSLLYDDFIKKYYYIIDLMLLDESLKTFDLFFSNASEYLSSKIIKILATRSDVKTEIKQKVYSLFNSHNFKCDANDKILIYFKNERRFKEKTINFDEYALLLKSNCVDVNAPIKRTYEISVKEESKTSKRKIEVLFSPFVVIFDIKKRQLLLSNGFDKNKKFQRLKHYNLDHTFNSVNSAYEYVDYYDQLKIERPIDENTNS